MTLSLQVQSLEVRLSKRFVAGPLSVRLGPGLAWLRGPNGAGKTTLLRALCGDLVPTSGRVHLQVGASSGDPHRRPLLRRFLGYLPAVPDTPDFLTVDEAWRLAAGVRGCPDWPGVRLREALALPGGLRVAHASSGQRRRIELLAALVGDPPILLLDEPFAHLDQEGCDWLAEAIADWRSERIVLLTGHGPPPVAPDLIVELPGPLRKRAG